jgi:hypothetical protein
MPSGGFVTKCNNWLRSRRHDSVKTGTRGGDGRTAPARGHLADVARIFPAINDFSMVTLPNSTIFRGDMGSHEDLGGWRAQWQRPSTS